MTVSAGAAGEPVGGGSNELARGDGGASGNGALAGGAGGEFDPSASYPCEGPEAASAGSGGQAGEAGQAASPLRCAANRSFCYVFAGLASAPEGDTVYVPECRAFSDSLAKCATNPSCACLCTRFACNTECRCNEVNGLATVTCHQI